MPVLRALRRPWREGWAILTPLLLGALATRRRPRASALLLAATGIVAAALRDPDRVALSGDDALAPADGQVVAIGPVVDDYLGIEMLEISIFLALWDVHVQRAPLNGRLVHVRTDPGAFRPAFISSAAENYRQSLYLETDWGPCVVVQMAGLVARRIVRWVEPGDALRAGDRIGMIKFGSRVSVRLPRESRPLVAVGDAVRAGLTPVARRVLESSA